MEEKDLLEENKIPGEGNVGGGSIGVEDSDNGSDNIAENGNVAEESAAPAETGTADNGEVNEAPEVEQESEENDVVEIEAGEPGENEPVEKMLPQSQVNELVGRARAEGRESAMKELYGRYGVNNDNEMNDIFGRGQGYDLLNEEYTGLQGRYGNLEAENALLKTQVVPGRWDDVKAILGSKGLAVSVENIEAEFTTHPEWRSGGAPVEETGIAEITPEAMEGMAEKSKVQNAPAPQVSQVKKIGTSVPEPKVDTEENDVMKYFGLK